jgi:hypothetical protein
MENILNKKIFSGISKSGDVNTAIANAVQNAKEQLRTDYVEWELSKLSGKDGGLIALYDIEASILIVSTSQPL